MYIEVDLLAQKLTAFDDSGEIFMETLVSTARNGPGEIQDSNCTPRGWHQIRAKIGDSMPENTVFRGRRPMNVLYCGEMNKLGRRDWILTRILWLSGLEPGFNRSGNVDSMRRYIYIHGCPNENPMGIPDSAGCIKMRNSEIIDLFTWVEIGTLVNIQDDMER